MVLASDRTGGLLNLYSATRATVNSPFTAPTQTQFALINPGGATTGAVISPNGLELYYGREPGESGAQSSTYRATRLTTALPFSNPQPMPNVQVGSGVHSPQYISNDGLRLYCFNTSKADDLTTGLYVSSLPNVDSIFGSPSNAPFAPNIPNGEEMYLSSDELQLYYNVGGGDMMWSWRPDLSSPFSAGVNLTSISSLGDSGAPVLSFGNQLFFNHIGDIWKATLVPEPAMGGMIAVMLAGMIRRRAAR
jgi:hypothetical protein